MVFTWFMVKVRIIYDNGSVGRDAEDVAEIGGVVGAGVLSVDDAL